MDTQADILNLWRSLPELVRQAILLIRSHQVQVLIVGGPVRDYFLFHRFPKQDFDIELRFQNSPNFKKVYPEIKEAISNLLGRQAKLQNYDVACWEREDFSLDIAPARKEIFIPHQVGHSNFTVEILFNPSDELAFKRRDFSINAMGVEYLGGDQNPQLRLADPFSGREHLAEKKMYPCSEDFSKDPLRLIRACRFMANFSFHADAILLREFKRTDLSGLTPAHFWAEYFKAKRPVEFLSLLQQFSPLAKKNLPPPLILATNLFPVLKECSSLDPAFFYNLSLLYFVLPCENRASWAPLFLSHTGESPGEWQALEKFIKILESGPPPELPIDNFEAFKLLPQLAEIKFVASFFKKNAKLMEEMKKHVVGKLRLENIDSRWWEWIEFNWTKKLQNPEAIPTNDRGTYQLWTILTQ